MEPPKRVSRIGSLNEKPLHAALKKWIAGPTDQFEVSVDGFIIDIVQGDCLVEIQTRNFASIKRKLMRLTVGHKVRLMYPIAHEKWIVKRATGMGGMANGRRKSPKRGGLEQIFEELVAFPKLLANPNFSLMLLLIREEELRRYDAVRGWRRKGWVTEERRLLEVVDQRLIESTTDMGAFIPSGMTEPFTTLDLAAAMGQSRRFAQKMAYCLREMGVIAPVGTRARAILYTKVVDANRNVV